MEQLSPKPFYIPSLTITSSSLVSGEYTLGFTGNLIFIDMSGIGSFTTVTINLPAVTTAVQGYLYRIQRMDTNAYASVTLAPYYSASTPPVEEDEIGGSTSAYLLPIGGTVELSAVPSSRNWVIISSGTTTSAITVAAGGTISAVPGGVYYVHGSTYFTTINLPAPNTVNAGTMIKVILTQTLASGSIVIDAGLEVLFGSIVSSTGSAVGTGAITSAKNAITISTSGVQGDTYTFTTDTNYWYVFGFTAAPGSVAVS